MTYTHAGVYRLKRATVTAAQFWPSQTPWPAGVERHPDPRVGYRLHQRAGVWVRVQCGDWIVRESDGHVWACHNSNFRRDYDPV